MATVIKHNTFFQQGLTLQNNWRALTTTYDEKMATLFQQRHVYTRFDAGQSRLIIGKDRVKVGVAASIEPYTTFGRGNHFFSMGAFSYSWSQLPVNTIVGRYTSIGSRVRQLGHNHPLNRFTTSSVSFDGHLQAYQDYLQQSGLTFAPVANPQRQVQPIVLGNDVLIGDDVVFGNDGVVVSDGAVVAAGSLVTHDVPPYAVVAGWPANVIKYRCDFRTIDQLLDLRWWQYDFGQFGHLPADDKLTTFVAKVNDLASQGKLQPFVVEPLTKSMLQATIATP